MIINCTYFSRCLRSDFVVIHHNHVSCCSGNFAGAKLRRLLLIIITNRSLPTFNWRLRFNINTLIHHNHISCCSSNLTWTYHRRWFSNTPSQLTRRLRFHTIIHYHLTSRIITTKLFWNNFGIVKHILIIVTIYLLWVYLNRRF